MKINPFIMRLLEYSPVGGIIPGAIRINAALNNGDVNAHKLAIKYLNVNNQSFNYSKSLELLRGAVSYIPILNAAILIPIDIARGITKIIKNNNVENNDLNRLENAKDALATIINIRDDGLKNGFDFYKEGETETGHTYAEVLSTAIDDILNDSSFKTSSADLFIRAHDHGEGFSEEAFIGALHDFKKEIDRFPITKDRVIFALVEDVNLTELGLAHLSPQINYLKKHFQKAQDALDEKIEDLDRLNSSRDADTDLDIQPED